MPALVATGLGILLGYGCGGSLGALSRLDVRFGWLVLGSFIVQSLSRGRILGLVAPTTLSLPLWVLSSVTLLIALFVNRKIPGMVVAGIGLLLNLDVFLANAAMPVGGATLGAKHAVQVAQGILRSGGFYRAVDASTLLAWLSDTIPVQAGVASTLLSAGDLLLMIAVVTVIVSAMTGAARSPQELAT